jgi:ketosteroid isomerase-like protein
LNRNGQTSDVAETVSRSARSKEVLRAQTFAITSMVESGATVVIEARWSGELAVDVGPLKAGKTMAADFCMVFEFRDGLIHRVRNYDCFAPF